VNHEAKNELIVQGVSSTPAWAAVMTWLFGVTLEKWVAVCGLVFLVLQAAYLVWKWRRDHRREAERLRRGDPPPNTDKGAL